MLAIHDLHSDVFEALQRELTACPRMHGYYILKLVSIDPTWATHEEDSLDTLFESFDDHPWPPPSQRPQGGAWTDQEVSEEAGAQEAIAALIGGREAGHLRDTLSPDRAADVWRRFRALFSERARFFVGLGLGDRAYAFQRGTVIVDVDRAGALCIVEGD